LFTGQFAVTCALLSPLLSTGHFAFTRALLPPLLFTGQFAFTCAFLATIVVHRSIHHYLCVPVTMLFTGQFAFTRALLSPLLFTGQFAVTCALLSPLLFTSQFAITCELLSPLLFTGHFAITCALLSLLLFTGQFQILVKTNMKQNNFSHLSQRSYCRMQSFPVGNRCSFAGNKTTRVPGQCLSSNSCISKVWSFSIPGRRELLHGHNDALTCVIVYTWLPIFGSNSSGNGIARDKGFPSLYAHPDCFRSILLTRTVPVLK
jgi:hypothetical protein